METITAQREHQTKCSAAVCDAQIRTGQWVLRGSGGRVFCSLCAAFILGPGARSEAWLRIAHVHGLI